MAIVIVQTNDTIRVQGTFRNTSDALTDADGQAVTFNLYNGSTKILISSAAATRASTGVYYYDYLVPEFPAYYYVELSGLFSTALQAKRIKIKSKFEV